MFYLICLLAHSGISLTLARLQMPDATWGDVLASIVNEPGPVFLFCLIFVVLKARGARFIYLLFGIAWYNRIRSGVLEENIEFTQVLFVLGLVFVVLDIVQMSITFGPANNLRPIGRRFDLTQTATCPNCHGTGTWAIGSAAIGSEGLRNRVRKMCSRCGGQGTVRE